MSVWVIVVLVAADEERLLGRRACEARRSANTVYRKFSIEALDRRPQLRRVRLEHDVLAGRRSSDCSMNISRRRTGHVFVVVVRGDHPRAPYADARVPVGGSRG